MKKLIPLLIVIFSLLSCQKQQFDLTDFEVHENSKNNSEQLNLALQSIKKLCRNGQEIYISLPKGTYHFYEKGTFLCEYYISNHDQDNPKRVVFNFDEWENLVFDGNGSKFIFHGRLLPFTLKNSKNCKLKNFSIDFENPHIAQVKIVENQTEKGIVFRTEDWVNARISSDNTFEVYDEAWTVKPVTGIAFEPKTNHIVYRTSDLICDFSQCEQIDSNLFFAPNWKDERLKPQTKIALRNYYRPAPAIFLVENYNTEIENVKVHYAEGMGLLAQLCENITLNNFSVCLEEESGRVFTTQADATHFSSCKGRIISKNGLYENMMDDAINVHGTYLKIVQKIDNNSLIAKYMHNQSWGFKWGEMGDEVQFVSSNTMEVIGEKNIISSIKPYNSDDILGAKEFLICFEKNIDSTIFEKESVGIENLTWCPEVIFTENIIRNNRARGALFSTPKDVIVENNFFDHTSGTAILLCGDCNGWFETGACRNVTIRNNRFVNALTNMFQFTNAIISIYPEIPNLAEQKQYFHGGEEQGIVIENNLFETFDQPIVFAKSLNGLIFRENKIVQNSDYEPFHWNKNRFLFQHTKNIKIENNKFSNGFDETKDVIFLEQ